MKATNTTVDSTKAWLLYASNGPEAETVTMDNQGSTDVILGDSTLTSASSGVLLRAADPPLVITMKEDSIYGITASASSKVEVLAVLGGGGF